MSNLLQRHGLRQYFIFGPRKKVDKGRRIPVEYRCIGTLTIE